MPEITLNLEDVALYGLAAALVLSTLRSMSRSNRWNNDGWVCASDRQIAEYIGNGINFRDVRGCLSSLSSRGVIRCERRMKNGTLLWHYQEVKK